MSRTILSTIMLVFLAGALPQGQSANIRIAFAEGRVTLVASEALAADVLGEWARVGGTVITGADRLPAERLTVNLVDVAERVALDAVLGTGAGYVSAVRTEFAAGQSLLRTLQIVLPSSAPARPVRVVDMNLPEARYEYASPVEDPDVLIAQMEAARRNAPPPQPPTAGPQLPPEARYTYPEPMVIPPLPAEEPEAKPEPKPDPKIKKPPSGL